MTLFRTPLLVVDTETTGFLSNPHAQPWEIGAVLLDRDGVEVATFSAVGCPLVLEPDMQGALDIGGVTLTYLRDQSPMSEVAWHFQDWIDGQDPQAMWTAFNVAFDRQMLERVGLRGSRWAPCIMEKVKPIMGEAGHLPWYNKYHDYKMPRLSEAAAFFEVPQQEPAHRALADARTAGLIAAALVRRMRRVPRCECEEG